jgi:nucleoside-diphosphate-sugar epimerase
MKVLVYGKGWIGSQVIDLLEQQNHEVVIGSVRANDKAAVEGELLKVKPTHVMSFIGRTHGSIDGRAYTTIDYLEQKGKVYENVRDNLFGPMVLGMLCNKHDIHLTYLGTGCIFEFDDVHPYGSEERGFTEEDRPNFFGSSYSVVKGFTDELMHLFESNVLNVRIRMPITADKSGRNFITKITTYEKICSVPNSMTVLPELLPIMIDMAENKRCGTINLTNPGLITHNEILEMYREIVDPEFEWKNFTIEEQAEILAAGRSNNFLDTTSLEEAYPNVKHIKESVRDVLEQMKNNQNQL